MDEISEILKKSGNLEHKFMAVLLKMTFPPSYYAKSIEDFVCNKKEIKKGANFFQIIEEPILFNKVIITIPQLKYAGIKENLITLEDFSSKLTAPPLDKLKIIKNIEEERIYEGCRLDVCLAYNPRNRNLWVYDLFIPKIPRKQEKPAYTFEDFSSSAYNPA